MSPYLKLLKASKAYRWLRELGRCLSQTINAVAGGFSQESTSSRLGRTRPDCLICKLLSVFERDHCRRAADRERPIVEYLRSISK